MLLALETSCDETAAAIVEKDNGGVRVRASVVSSQIALHAPWGGVVPNLAAREHVKNIAPVIEAALREANATRGDIDAIAVTAGPGLLPALHIGVAAAKTLSYRWRKPLLGIHHIEGHIYANFINQQLTTYNKQPTEKQARYPLSVVSCQLKNPFPLLALVVSGGHTELVLMRDHFEYEILGETEDDAAGEAFDKVARMLGLPYPGGPEIARCAARRAQPPTSNNQLPTTDYRLPTTNFESNSNSEIQSSNIQSKFTIHHSPFSFPRPLIDSPDYRFSFSGLKTAVLYFLKKHEDKKRNENFVSAVCFEFQEAVVDVLIEKTRRAIIDHQPKTVIIAGGVSANERLREQMAKMIERDFPETAFRMPPLRYSLDNAAMIGAAALFRWERMNNVKKTEALARWRTLRADPNLPLGN